MTGEKIISLFTAMLVIAGISVLVQSPNTTKVFATVGNTWIGSVHAIMGK
jgi:hypothetical protein